MTNSQRILRYASTCGFLWLNDSTEVMYRVSKRPGGVECTGDVQEHLRCMWISVGGAPFKPSWMQSGDMHDIKDVSASDFKYLAHRRMRSGVELTFDYRLYRRTVVRSL